MTAFRAVLVDAVQIDNLISDPELASAEARLGAAIASRASQASVNSLGDTLGPAIVNATADKAKSTEVAAAQAALAQLIAPKATGADLDAAQTAILAAQATVKTDTLAALGTTTAPLATTAALTAAQAALAAAVAPKATSAELTATQVAVTAAIAPKSTSAEVAAAQAALAQLLTLKASGADLAAAQTAILAAQATAKTDTLAALTTATAPLATSVAVSSVQAALAACIAPKATSAELAAAQTVVLAAVALKATSSDLAAAQTAILSMQGLAHTDTLAAIAPKSTSAEVSATQATITANAAADRAAILAAIASAGVAPGEVKNFLATAIPAGFTRLSNTDFVPSGGVVESSVASTTGTGFGDAVYVATGANPGIWRYRIDRFQRFDLATNVPLGSAYLCPTTTTSPTGIPVALAVIGSKIFLAGVGTGSGYTASAKFYVFDTNTLVFTALADFPRALSSASGLRAIVLTDNRILFASSSAVGLTITPAATPFWVYDPVSGVAPVEVIVSLSITKFLGNSYDLLMQMLPQGQILLLDSAAPTSGNALSCCLTVTGNSIAVSAAEDIGLGSVTPTSTGWFLPTATGALLGSAGTVRTYVYGSGWGAGTVPNAYGVISNGLRAKRIAGVGWLLVSGPVVGGGCLYINLFLTAVPSAGSLVVQAVRN